MTVYAYTDHGGDFVQFTGYSDHGKPYVIVDVGRLSNPVEMPLDDVRHLVVSLIKWLADNAPHEPRIEEINVHTED